MNIFVKNLIVPAAAGLVATLGIFSMTGCHGDGERVTVIEHAQPAPPPPSRTVIVTHPPQEQRVIVAPAPREERVIVAPPPPEHRVIVAPARPAPAPCPRERIVIHDKGKPGKGGPAHVGNGHHGDKKPVPHHKGDKKGDKPGKGHPDDKNHDQDRGEKHGR